MFTGESNISVDNILKKLKKYKKINFTRVGTSEKIPLHLKQYTLDYKIKHYLENNPINDAAKQEVEEKILNDSQVILTTNSSAARKSLSNIPFHIVIIDEASQATIPSVLIPINKAKNLFS